MTTALTLSVDNKISLFELVKLKQHSQELVVLYEIFLKLYGHLRIRH